MFTPEVIYENKDFLVINKPAGLVVHPSAVSKKKIIDERKAAEPTLVDWLLKNYPEVATVGDDPRTRPGIVHRLDKETSGVMLVARRQQSFEHLKELFKTHQMKKKYKAIVFGVRKKEEGIIDAAIGIKNGTLKRSIHSSKMAKPAITAYKIVRSFSARGDDKKEIHLTLLEVTPKTGRTHQIRVHLASIGNPIAGDRLYGQKKQPSFAPRVLLHASAISFSDEQGNRFDFETSLPGDFAIE